MTGIDQPVSPATSSDNCPVSAALEIAKAVVKAADPELWWRLWESLSGGITELQERSAHKGQAYPWEQAEGVTCITWSGFQGVLERSIMAVLPGNSDIPERRKLVHAAARKHDEIMAKGSNGARPIRATRFGQRVCALPGCGTRFGARSLTHYYCCPNHRAAHYRQRLAARRAS